MALFILTKVCNKCFSVLPTVDFYKNNTLRDGFMSACALCVRKEVSKYRKANPEKCKTAQRKSINAKPEKYKEYQSNHRRQNFDKYKEWDRTYYENNTAKHREAGRKWATANKDKIRKMQKESRLRHPETRKIWRSNNKEHVREMSKIYSHRRRLLFANTRRDFTLEQWKQIKVFYRNRCAFCGEKKQLTQDHVIPVSKGGEHTASNIIPLCLPCNLSKGNREINQPFQPHLFMFG